MQVGDVILHGGKVCEVVALLPNGDTVLRLVGWLA